MKIQLAIAVFAGTSFDGTEVEAANQLATLDEIAKMYMQKPCHIHVATGKLNLATCIDAAPWHVFRM